MTQVIVSSAGDLRQEIWAGEHTLTADEPVGEGGSNAGPTPYELLLAALGACMSMTMLVFAKRRQWPLEHVEVRLVHHRHHAQDCAECEQPSTYLDHVEKQIVVSGALTDEQVRKLGEIAEKCPVNKTLRQSVQTTQEIRLAGADTREPSQIASEAERPSSMADKQ